MKHAYTMRRTNATDQLTNMKFRLAINKSYVLPASAVPVVLLQGTLLLPYRYTRIGLSFCLCLSVCLADLSANALILRTSAIRLLWRRASIAYSIHSLLVIQRLCHLHYVTHCISHCTNDVHRLCIDVIWEHGQDFLRCGYTNTKIETFSLMRFGYIFFWRKRNHI